MELSEVSLICKALSDQNRLQIVHLLTDGEQCACELLEQMKITQPTLSHHMRVLEKCSLVKTLREVVKYGDDYPFSPDNPPCPDCGHEMQFFGHDENGDFPEGEGYWQCPGCRFRFYEYNF